MHDSSFAARVRVGPPIAWGRFGQKVVGFVSTLNKEELMSFKKLFIGSAALLSVAACSKANDHKPSAGAVSAPAYDSKAQGVGTYTAGTPLYSFGVASKSLSWDGKIIDLNDRSMFVDANIASQVSALAAVDKVIQTKEQSLELWSAGNLLLAFDLRSGVPTMISMGSNFQITSASFVMNSSSDQKQGQALVSADLMLNMQDCAAEQKQEQGKQEQGKPEQKIANCHAVMMAFHLSEISESKQEQGKQEQGKQDQGKQGQDQGKAPAPTEPGKQGQDQGKQGQDQGKAPVPTEPGKQGQEQGKQGK